MDGSGSSRNGQKLPRGRAGFLERLSSFLVRSPEDREELMRMLLAARDRSLIDDDALAIIEGGLQISDMVVREIMVPRSLMNVLDVNKAPRDFLPFILETQHSRFPVIDTNHDNVVGIFLAKDMLRFLVEEDFSLRNYLRPAVFVPESKRLNKLLSDFRRDRYHMALVVDEYGGISGLVTIEDILEQIVGDIDDEFDFDDPDDLIVADEHGGWRVKAGTDITDFNTVCGVSFSADQYGTVAGLLMHHAGCVMRRGQSVKISPLIFRIIHADSRRVHLVHVCFLEPNEDEVPQK